MWLLRIYRREDGLDKVIKSMKEQNFKYDRSGITTNHWCILEPFIWIYGYNKKNAYLSYFIEFNKEKGCEKSMEVCHKFILLSLGVKKEKENNV